MSKARNITFWVVLIATLVTLVIACCNWGPAVLLPENYPTPEQRGVASNIFNHLLVGTDAPSDVPTPATPLPWATGTWFWWKMEGILFLLFCIVSWDHLLHGLRGAMSVVQRHIEEEHSRREAAAHHAARRRVGNHEEGAEEPAAHGGHRPGFWEVFSFGLLVEIMGEFIVHFMEHRRRGVA